MVAVKDAVAVEDTKVVVAAEALARYTNYNNNSNFNNGNQGGDQYYLTIKGLLVISTTTAITSKVVVATKALTIKDPLKVKVKEESIFTQEGE